MSASDDLPEEVKERAEAIKENNPSLSKSEAIAIARDQLNLAADDDCPNGQTNVRGECVEIPESKHVDAPASILSDPQHLTLKSLDTEPIERESNGDTVRYKNLKLLSPGIWADAGSQTETYYPPEGIAALEADYGDEHDGPPVNIMHDLDMESFDAHEASVAGHVDPKSLDTDDDGNLFGDIVLDTSNGAGQFADENLSSTLEKEGTVGFGGPSVEIPAEGLQQSHDETRDMPRVDGGLLSGVALVMDPASKSVSFAREAARRPVALSGASGDNVKVLSRKDTGMRTLQDPEEVREVMERFGFDVGDMDDEEMMDMAEDLHEDLMEQMQEPEDGEGEDQEMESDDGEDEEEDEEDAEMESDGDDEDEDDEDQEMADDGVEAMQERVQNLAARLEDLEDAVAQAMTADDVGSELAAADSVEELDHRLTQIEDEPKDSKTLADTDESDLDFSEADSGVDYDPATGSMSGR